MAQTLFRRWRRLDYPGLEIINIREDSEGWTARSVITDGSEEPFGLVAEWRLDADWRSRSLDLTLIHPEGERSLQIVRVGEASWRVNNQARPDLDGCAEIDVSATPFCNGLAIRHLNGEPGELTALYVLASALSVEPSRQRYERLGPRQWRYVDLGVAKGFTAVLDFNSDRLVRSYEGLFEALG